MKVFLDTNIFLEYLEQRRDNEANLRDFRNADMTEMDILSPFGFVDKYL